MKKFTVGLLATATVIASLSPVTVRATGTTTGGDTVSTTESTEPAVPTQCLEYLGAFGPSRAAHSSARPGIVIDDLPDCEDIEGICVQIILTDVGPGRAPHGVDTTEVPCVPAGPACDIVVELQPSGPARAAHQSPSLARPASKPIVVDIPQDCQDVLSAVAIPTTGSDSSNIIWLGAVLVGLGAVLLTTRRVATVRSR